MSKNLAISSALSVLLMAGYVLLGGQALHSISADSDAAQYSAPSFSPQATAR